MSTRATSTTTTRVLLAAFATTLLVGTGGAQSLLAPTPPMGWNSWDSFGTTVTEDEVRANAGSVLYKVTAVR